MIVSYDWSITEHEASLTRYMKVSKKKDLPKVREDASEDLFVYRKKRHQVGTFLFDFQGWPASEIRNTVYEKS